MKAVSQTYKDNIKELGKEIDSYITYTYSGTSYDIGSENINSANLHYEGGILKSVMKQLDLELTQDIPLNIEITFRFGIKVSDNSYDETDPIAYRTNYEYINYGTFIVYSSEKLEDSNSYKLTCYDKIIYSMKDYEANYDYVLTTDTMFDDEKTYYEYNSGFEEYTGSMYFLTTDNVFIEDKKYFEYEDNEYIEYDGDRTGNPSSLGLYEMGNPNTLGLFEYKYVSLPFPMTVKNYLNTICSQLNLTFANVNDTFPNYDKIIPNELYLDVDGNSLNYTYRDILDELSQVTAGNICINSNDELEIRYITDTNTSIDEESLRDINVNFGEMVKPINTITFKRSADSDAISLSNPEDLDDSLKNEIVISGNQILNFDNRDEYLQDILNKLYGLTYSINDFNSTGITYYELCDKYNVSITKTDDEGNTIETNTYSCVMFNDEININQGLEEIVYTEMPDEITTDYNRTTKTDRLEKRTDLIVNKQEGFIEAITGSLQIGSDGQSEVVNGVISRQTETESIINIITSKEIVDGEEVVTGVKTTKGFTFDKDGLNITSSDNTYRTKIDETGTYYYDDNEILGQTTNDGSKFKNMDLYGEFRYGKDEINDNPMFVGMLYTYDDGNGNTETGFGHFYNGS